MGSKGSNTTTQNQFQTYVPNQAATNYITNALDRAYNTSNLPFNMPQAPVAGFSGDQTQAFQGVRNAQGMAQPYFNQAQGYFNQSAQGPNVSQFFNPYADAVTSNLKDIFGKQMSDTTGKLTQAAGGIGADRIAVGQSELAKQQGLSAGQTLANLYQPSLQAALQEQGVLQGAGYGTAALGPAAQNAALSGSNALLGVGGLQQQLQQAQLNSPYQLALAKAAFPYQQSQFYSGAVGSLAPGLGGTTSGTATTTPPTPSMFSQLLGAGTFGLGAYNAFGGGGKGSNPSYGMGNGVWGGSSSNPLPGLDASDYGPGFARGGRTDPFVLDLPRRHDGSYGYDDGGSVSDDPIDISAHPFIPTGQIAAIKPTVPQLNFSSGQQQSGGGGGSGFGWGDAAKLGMQAASMAMMFSDKRLKENIKPVGKTNDGQTIYSYNFKGSRRTQMGLLAQEVERRHPEAVRDIGGFKAVDYGKATKDARRADGGRIDPYAFAEGGPPDDDVINPDEPFRMPSPEAVQAWRDDTPVGPLAFSRDPQGGELPLPIRRPAGAGAPMAPATAPVPQTLNPYSAAPAGPSGGGSDSFMSSPWAGLMAAGLGIMSGTSPYAGVNIGQGGMHGLKTLEAARAAAQKDTTIAQAARRLEIEAKHHEDQYSRMTPYQKAQVDMNREKAEIEKMKPVMIGQDDYGRPVYAKRNPQTGEFEIIKTDKESPTAPTVPSAPPVPATPPVAPDAKTPVATASREEEEGGLPKNAQFTQGTLEPTNPAALEGLKEADARQVRAIGEGRQAFLPLGRNNPYNRYIMEKVHEAYPDADASTFSRRQKTQNSFSTGVEGRNVTAINTFGQHLDEYIRLSKEMDLGSWKDWNEVRNALTERGYNNKEAQNKIGELKAAVKAIGDEGAKVFAGSQSALADREEWAKIFDPANPKDVALAKAKQMVKLVEGRLNALTDTYNQGMRTNRAPQDLIAKRTREIFEKAKNDTSEAEAAKPKKGDRKQFRQGWGTFDGEKWVPD